MSDEKKTILRPGFSSEEPEPPREEIDPGSAMAGAHYAGMTETEAAEVFQRETLCRTCMCQAVCPVPRVAEHALTVVSRCLSYLPGAG